MTIEQLQYFYAIHENQTFSQAAVEMNITQSALSKQILKLEQELNVSLFDRTHRQITLTKAGESLLKDSQLLLEQYETMLDHLHQLQKDDEHTLRIAMLPIFSQYNLSHKIKDFKKQFPDTHLDIHEVEERDLSHHITHHNFDVYILRGEMDELQSYQKVLLYEDSLSAVISKENPLSHQHDISIQQLKDEKLLLMPQYTTITKLSIQACLDAHFKPHIARHGRIETILAAASDNEGIALVMKKSLHIFHLSNVNILPIQENIHGDILLYYANDRIHRNVIENFVSFVRPINTKAV